MPPSLQLTCSTTIPSLTYDLLLYSLSRCACLSMCLGSNNIFTVLTLAYLQSGFDASLQTSDTRHYVLLNSWSFIFITITGCQKFIIRTASVGPTLNKTFTTRYIDFEGSQSHRTPSVSGILDNYREAAVVSWSPAPCNGVHRSLASPRRASASCRALAIHQPLPRRDAALHAALIRLRERRLSGVLYGTCMSHH